MKIKGTSRPIENEAKEQKSVWLPLLPSTLGAPLVTNMFSGLTGKCTVWAGHYSRNNLPKNEKMGQM